MKYESKLFDPLCIAERSGSVCRVLRLGIKMAHCQGSGCIVSLGKTLDLIQPRKTGADMTENIDRDVKNQTSQTNSLCTCKFFLLV